MVADDGGQGIGPRQHPEEVGGESWAMGPLSSASHPSVG